MDFHAKNIDQTAAELKTDLSMGLSEGEARERLKQNGPNRLKKAPEKTILCLFLEQLKDWLIYVLFAAVLITVYLGALVDAAIISGVILINAFLGVYQQRKAAHAVEALQKISSPKSYVKRGGKRNEIDSGQLVAGDVVVLETGRMVGADLRLVESVNLRIEEAALTGESQPSEKDAASVITETNAPLGDRKNLAFMGTTVTAGRGTGIVTTTGMETEIGKIAGIIQNEPEEKTPLAQRLDQLGKILGFVAVAVCVFLFVLSWFQGRDVAEMFLISVSLAVASIPEGLAAIVAVVLSVGVTAMSKNNAIIKKLPAVETLGSVNIICTDKTGTLTQNKMTVEKFWTSEGLFQSGNGVDPGETARLLVKGMILASDATLEKGESTGDPTEIALLKLGDDLNINRAQLARETVRLEEIPFDSARKMMSVLIRHGNELSVFAKGAPGKILEKSTMILKEGTPVPLNGMLKNEIRKVAEEMSDEALRTLALAYRQVATVPSRIAMEQDLILVGIAGMIDPPREEAKPAIEKARNAGITTLMITGDHAHTAFAIGKDLGIAVSEREVVTGRELDETGEDQLRASIGNYRIFARVSPEHKVKIIRALKAGGNIVSMTGDGVNDAPSLNAADIGVVMGITGTDVAKSAADMILTDDNFSTIVKAVEHGRNIYRNIRKAVIFLLSCNFGEVISMVAALLIGWPAPLLATQLLWINLITDSLPAIALGMDPGDPEVMNERPRSSRESFFSHGGTLQVVLGGLLIGAITVFGYWYGFYELGFSPMDQDIPDEVLKNARTLAFLILVFAQLFYSLALRHRRKSVFTIGIFSNPYLIGALVLGVVLQLLLLFVPFLQDAFQLHFPDAGGWLTACGLGLVPLVFSEVHKLFKRILW
ncbi:cation-translocating P-type ATPase [Chryseobacterium sp. R2A-55]|uniref:cation-translocating P-type ATPase n=1 Tax=Chryseobacterium sp. R2A-55 TaxID=2744445 RepID=UPI001F3E4F66|nr:cation-translocating P-type ATPase [Chryseobacterium sp. R2A-55]